MNNELMVKKLQEAGVKFTPGLSGEEFRWVEETYDFRFPSEIRDFFAHALPVSHGFYNWRDQTGTTMQQFQQFQASIEKAFLFDLAHNEQDLKLMLSEPFTSISDRAELKESILAYLRNSTKLIPLCRHRCFFDGMDNMPIISFWQPVDTIFYGENLELYLQREFLGLYRPIQTVTERMRDTGIWYLIVE